MSISVKHKVLIPEQKILANFDNIKKNVLTFGIHKQDNNKHPNRDKLSQMPAHKAFYNNNASPKPISNVELMVKHTNGFSTTVFVENKPFNLDIPKRPVIEPVFDKIVIKDDKARKCIFRGIKKQLNRFDNKSANLAFKRVKNMLGFRAVAYFITARGGNYWTAGAKRNSPYVQAIKTIETFNAGNVDLIYQENKIKALSDEAKAELGIINTIPLIDSMDLLNSIKAKVGK